jgi:hypothetical protein
MAAGRVWWMDAVKGWNRRCYYAWFGCISNHSRVNVEVKGINRRLPQPHVGPIA